MTTTEILQAHLLDILFDGRNKEYGAYTIRRGYNHRLLMALGIGLSLILVLIIMNSFTMHGAGSIVNAAQKDTITLTTVNLPANKLPEPVQPVIPHEAAPPVKSVKSTTPEIVPDNTLERTEAPDNATITDNAIGTTTTTEGSTDPGAVVNKPEIAGTTAAPADIPEAPPLPSFPPEFPGGFKALQEFLLRNLNTPDNLENGEKKIVKARFFVDKDGSVSMVQIDVSAGTVFDKEVIRVCKKMPKWKPAIQNGHPVAVSYVLPVTFIGVEQ